MADWPQWRGPQRTGITVEPIGWKGGNPRRVWQANIGQGFSSVAVVGERLYTMGNVNGTDFVHCLNPQTGKVLWQHRYRCNPGDYSGPRATPTVAGGRVYTLSREALALCLDAASGKVLWQQQLRGDAPQWGFASSPLVLGNQILYNVGGSGTALDKTTGKVIWSSRGKAGYSSAVPFRAGGQSGIALFVSDGLVGVNPASGQVLWKHPWQTQYDVNAADPIFAGDSVFISSNYGRGGALINLRGGRPSVAWENRSMRNHFNTCLLLGGHLYGNDENTLRCLELRSGAERWSMRGMDKGGLIASDNKLIILTGRGELVLAAVNPQKLTELARATVLDGTCWTHPALSNGMLYCRNQEGTLIALNLRG